MNLRAISRCPLLPYLEMLFRSSSRTYGAMAAGGARSPLLYFDEEKEKDDGIPASKISKPLSDILKQLNKKIPESFIRIRLEEGFSVKYIPWHIVNRIMNLHAPEWSGEVRSITYSSDGKTVTVVYRVTLYGTDAEIYRDSTGTTRMDDTGYGDPVQKAEAMAFRRACARLGLGLHLYHKDLM